MKRISMFVYLLLTTLIVSAQSSLTSYTGVIKGYNINMGFKTGQVIVNNVITGLHNSYILTIQPDGSFSASFPLTYTQECWISLPFFNSTVYFEPGKKIINNFDISDPRKVSAVFKGDCATINNEINEVRSIFMDFDSDVIDNDIFRLTPSDYKVYFLQMKARKLKLIDSVVQTKRLHTTARNLARKQVTYSIMSILMNYNFMRESAYRRKMNISFDNRKPVLEEIKPDISYYDFLRSLSYNDQSNMASYGYYEFINRLMFLSPVAEEAQQASIRYVEEIIAHTPKDTSLQASGNFGKVFEDILHHKATIAGSIEKARPVILQKIINKDLSLELDLIYLQPFAQQLDMEKDTLSEADLYKIRSNLKNKMLIADLSALNDKMKENISDVQNSTSRQHHQLPVNIAADSIYTAILNQYIGKVIFVNFWATWCSPCIQSIKKMTMLKDELATDSNIVFLYITNHTSPEKAYQAMIPGIRGVHYRISPDQYNFFAGMFQITGIPHYVVINKKGIPVHKHFVWTEPDQIKKELYLLTKE